VPSEGTAANFVARITETVVLAKNMKKLAALLLLGVLCVGGSLPAYAQRYNAQQQARADRKAQKKQQKAQKKYNKAQKKAQKKMIKYDKKHTHLPR
jgi:uncharacterized protein HemX